MSVRTLTSFRPNTMGHVFFCVFLPKERTAVAEVLELKHWRLQGTPRMFLFIQNWDLK